MTPSLRRRGFRAKNHANSEAVAEMVKNMVMFQ